MNVDAILAAFNSSNVDYMLIGGMNYVLRHLPELTFDVDLWIADNEENLRRANMALPPGERNEKRITQLRKALDGRN
jgi:hypothetical protein